MAAYVPIDLHRHRSVVMQMAADGEVLGWVRLANDPETLVPEVLKAGEAPEVAIEATYGWYWAVDALPTAASLRSAATDGRLGGWSGWCRGWQSRPCALLSVAGEREQSSTVRRGGGSVGVFEEVHQSRITGSLAMFDRMIFKGHLTGLYKKDGAQCFLWSQGVPSKDFTPYAKAATERIANNARKLAPTPGDR